MKYLNTTFFIFAVLLMRKRPIIVAITTKENGMELWSYKVKNWAALARRAEYSPSKLAASCGVSLRQLQRHFHDVFGFELRNWIKALRLQDALHLFKDRSVKQVAFLLCFKQSNHFSREFKKHFGITPDSFRQQPQEPHPQVENEILSLREGLTNK